MLDAPRLIIGCFFDGDSYECFDGNPAFDVVRLSMFLLWQMVLEIFRNCEILCDYTRLTSFHCNSVGNFRS